MSGGVEELLEFCCPCDCTPTWLQLKTSPSSTHQLPPPHCMHCDQKLSATVLYNVVIYACRKRLDKAHFLMIPFCTQECTNGYYDDRRATKQTRFFQVVRGKMENLANLEQEHLRQHRRTGEMCLCCGVGGEEGAPLAICNGCRYVRYCSPECQKEDWKAHQEFCRAKQGKSSVVATLKRNQFFPSNHPGSTTVCDHMVPKDKHLINAANRLHCSHYGCTRSIVGPVERVFVRIHCYNQHVHKVPIWFCGARCRKRSLRLFLHLQVNGGERRVVLDSRYDLKGVGPIQSLKAPSSTSAPPPN